MDKRDYGGWDFKDLIEVVDSLNEDKARLVNDLEYRDDKIEDLFDEIEKLSNDVHEASNAVALLEEQIDVLEERLRERGMPVDSRNFTIDNLYYLLCDRYGVSHHTSKDKLKALVDEELSL